jgi:hypothetical protein
MISYMNFLHFNDLIYNNAWVFHDNNLMKFDVIYGENSRKIYFIESVKEASYKPLDTNIDLS